MPDDFRRSAATNILHETVTIQLDIDALTWFRANYVDWPEQINALICAYHDRSLMMEASCDPDAFEPGEMVADVPPEPEFP